MKDLPKTISSLVSLETLTITYNFITEIDESIGNLQNLKSFIIGSWLGSNPLKKLPESISKLQKLEEIYATNCELESLPELFVNLKNLENLDLSMNKISKLPKSIKKLKNLKRLNLKGNPISEEEQARLLKELPNCKITF